MDDTRMWNLLSLVLRRLVDEDIEGILGNFE